MRKLINRQVPANEQVLAKCIDGGRRTIREKFLKTAREVHEQFTEIRRKVHELIDAMAKAIHLPIN